MKSFAAIFCLIASLLSVHTAKTTCKLSDKNVNECVKSAVEQNFRTLHNPSKNKDFPLTDPYFFDFGQLAVNLPVAQGTVLSKNVTIKGAHSMKIEEVAVRSEGTKMQIKTKVSMPKLESSGWFKSNLTIYNSKGQFKLLSEGIQSQLILGGTYDESNKRFVVKNFDMIPTVKKMKMNLSGSPANDELNKSITQLVNETWDPIYKDIIKEAKSIWQPLGVEIMNELFGLIEFTR